MAKRPVLLCVPALVAGVLAAIAPSAGAALPSGTTKVPVAAAANASGIDGHLVPAASIAGKITAAVGGSISAVVSAYRGNTFVSSGFTDGTGHYLIGGLPASATGYAVCVNGSSVFGGNSTTGYLGRCYKTAAYYGGTIPGGATKVPLMAGENKTTINITIPTAAAISGKVTNGAGAGVGGASVIARDRASGRTFFGFTAPTGTYKITGVTPTAKDYQVCANLQFSSLGATGYLSRCFKNVAWKGGAFPSGATAVPVTVGHTHAGVNITLPKGAAISGTVNNAANGHPLNHVSVAAFNSSGALLTTASTNATGHYTLKGLPTSTSTRVCAFPENPSPAVAYQGRCWKTVAFNGGVLPAGTTPVSTSTGHTHTGINLRLPAKRFQLGSISGTVTEAAGDNVLQSAQVSLFNNAGQFLANVPTNASGEYTFSKLRANSTGYVVCAGADGTTTSTTPTPDTGWAARCHADVAWNGLAVPSGAERVPLTAGQNKTGVNVPLQVGGEISGIVMTNGVKSTTIGFATVKVFTPTGKLLDQTSAQFDGTYSFLGLTPNATGYIVCFDGRNVSFGMPNYLPQCWQNVSWDGND